MKIRQLAARVGFTSDDELGSFFGVTTEDIRAWNVSVIPAEIISTLEEMDRKNLTPADVDSPRAVGGLHLN